MPINANHFKFGLIVVGFAMLSSMALAQFQQAPVEVSPRQLYVGESLTLTVRVQNFEEGMPPPDLTQIPNVTVTPLGHSDSSFQSISIINGRRQVSGFSGRVYQYRIVPNQPGRYPLRPILIPTPSGNPQTLASPEIFVREIPQQNSVLLSLEASRTNLIVGEFFVVRLQVAIKSLPPPYDDESPLPPRAPPHLSIPYLYESFLEDFETDDFDERLQRMLTSETDAFHINEYTIARDRFDSFFGSDTPARFKLEQDDQTIRGQRYRVYTFDLELKTTQLGTYQFGPVVFDGNIIDRVNSNGEGILSQIYAISNPLGITIEAPPTDNQPPAFIGVAARTLDARANLASRMCYVGDPLELRITLTGDMDVDQLLPPTTHHLSPLEQNFRIYPDTLDITRLPNGREYSMIIRPKEAGTLELPPLPFAYFDFNSREYRTVYTAPVPLRVNAVTEMQSEMVINSEGRSMTLPAQRDDTRLHPAPVYIASNLLAREPLFDLTKPLLLAAIGPAMFFLALLLHWTRKLHPSALQFLSQRNAFRHANHQLTNLKAEDHNAIPRSRQIIRNALAHRFDGALRSATAEEIAERLQSQFSIAPEKVIPLLSPLPANESLSLHEIKDRAANLFKDLSEAKPPARKQHHKTSQRQVITIMFVLLSAAPAFASRITDFEMKRAQSLISNATSQEDFARAADAYGNLIDQGTTNGDIFYLYGTALLMAGQYEAAINALQRAERYQGSNWQIRRNLLLANRRLANDDSIELSWHRAPLFWHYRLPTRQRLMLAAAFFSLSWVLGIAVCFTHKEKFTHLLVLTSALLLIFLVSSLSSWLTEQQSVIRHRQLRASATLSTLDGNLNDDA